MMKQRWRGWEVGKCKGEGATLQITSSA